MSTAPPGYPTVPQHPAAPRHPELPDGITPTPPGPKWKPWMSFAALVAGFAAAVVGAIVVTIGAAAAGASFDDPPASVNILSLLVQDVCLVGAAIVFAGAGGAVVRPGDFGLRPTPFWRAVGWSVVTWIGFLVVTAAWVSLVGADNTDDELPKSLGVEDSDVALVSVALLVCVGAPLVEEFFFRGFFFTALRSWRGIWPAAVITGLVFGLIHAGSSDIAFLLPLGVFGFALCLLRVRTRSLYPCIGTHALNNSLAFGASQSWDWQILPLLAGSLALIALLLLGVRARFGPEPALAR